MIPLLIIPFILIASYGKGTLHYYGDEDEELGAEIEYDTLTLSLPTESGTISENSQMDLTFNVAKDDLSKYNSLQRVDVTVTWDSDESSSIIGGGSNGPDNMGFTLQSPVSDESVSASQSSSGSGSVTFKPALETKNSAYLGDWIVTLDCGDCGDDEGLLGLRSNPDNDSSYTVTVDFVYKGVKPSK